IALECRHGIPVRNPNDRLRSQMKNRVDLVLAQRSFEKVAVLYISPHRLHASDVAGSNQLAARYPVPHETYDIGATFQQSLDKPTANKSRCAGDEDRAVQPEMFRHAQTRHEA